jgi:hypothetical protein
LKGSILAVELAVTETFRSVGLADTKTRLLGFGLAVAVIGPILAPVAVVLGALIAPVGLGLILVLLLVLLLGLLLLC